MKKAVILAAALTLAACSQISVPLEAVRAGMIMCQGAGGLENIRATDSRTIGEANVKTFLAICKGGPEVYFQTPHYQQKETL